ncbi:MAG TPA: ornithine cyclodeaminase family protein [Candidatus Xenobia bacterium]|nr:ornithine cyclodeaminase family protein [Candidatus Xenobia bacterium]
MEVLYLTEADVARLLTMEVALEAVESAFRAAATGQVQNQPRRRLRSGAGAWFNYMAANDDGSGYFAMKIYTVSKHGYRFLVPLYRGDSGELVALIEAGTMGCLRTGAASGVATKYMARPDAKRAAIIGSGHQAPTQLEAIARVQQLESASVYSRDPERRRAFAEKMSAQLGVRVEAMASAEEAVRSADIVATITTAKAPVVEGAWLRPGTHVNAAGASYPHRREVDDEVVSRAARIAVDSREQAQMEAGDLLIPFQDNPQRWERVSELSAIVAGTALGRGHPEEITLFKSIGVALEDVAVAARVYQRARAEGVGRKLLMWEAEV